MTFHLKMGMPCSQRYLYKLYIINTEEAFFNFKPRFDMIITLKISMFTEEVQKSAEVTFKEKKLF